ncbi:MAG: DUF1549 and DUF1553 domain-containing protein, partial [Planctomycetes bacterium]|nr:DUF1549 and DUF1553 domain-containing protein [Planctomycetota bacterium]
VFVFLTTWLLITAAPVSAEGPLHVRVDQLVAERFEGREPAPVCDDATFVRRVWLDLAGRIPSAEEAKSFLDDTSPDKRTKLIDALLAAPTYRERMQDLFHVMLMERRGDDPEWRTFLKTCFEQNKPWNEMAAAILNPDAENEATRGAAFFYTKRLESYGQNPTDFPGLTRDVGRLFLGVDLQCAECHNHLFIDDYKQHDFQGLFAIYKNLAIRTDLKFPAVMEKGTGEKLSFISVFDPAQQETGPRIPFGEEVAVVEQPLPPNPPRNLKGPLYGALPSLADELPTAENELFTKNIVNRLWFVMMGEGLVMPLDLFHSENPPSHPELLDLLAGEFAAHAFDIKWLLRELALTQTYQRSSVLAEGQEPPPRNSYLLGNEKRLSAEQLLWSTLQATGNHKRLAGGDEAAAKELEDYKSRFVKAFANEPREPEVDFNATVAGALFQLNDAKMLALFQPQAGNLTERLVAMKGDDQAIDELFLSIFTRRPSGEERAAVKQFLDGNANREEALAHVAWSMVTAMEFYVNH